MASFNLVVLIGNLVANPELKTTSNGISVTSFRIAVKRRATEETDFIDIVAWRKTAEFIVKYFQKGSPILVRGTLQTRTWTTTDNQKRHTVEVIADDVSFVGKKEERQTPNYESKGEFEELPPEDDLPF